MIIPQILEDARGRYVIALESDFIIEHDFYCAIIFLNLDLIVESDVLEVLPGSIFVCRDEVVYNSAIRKGIVLGVISNEQQ